MILLHPEYPVAGVAKDRDAIQEIRRTAAELRAQYDRILTWADMFDGSTTEGKKMIAYQLIRQVRVYRNFRIEIDLKVSFEQFKDLWHREDRKMLVSFSE